MSDSSQDNQDPAQKTEEPTHKRLEDAKRKGQVAVSRDLNNWLVLVAASVVLLYIMPRSITNVMRTFEGLIERSNQYELDIYTTGRLAYEILLDMLAFIGPPFAIMFMVALLAGLSQNGLLFATESIEPKLSKISPLAGVKRLFSMRNLFEFLKGLLKIVIVAGVGALILGPLFFELPQLVGESMAHALATVTDIAFALLLVLLSILLVIAVIDLVYQRYSNRQKLMMTRQEIRDEFKNTEGDPQIKARLRRIRQERARRRMMQALPSADVVITNPTHYAIALQYDPQRMHAPVVVAKGIGDLALRIREKAEELQIPLVSNPPLARLLYDVVDVDQEIPPDQYRAVAEVISYVWSVRQRSRGGARAA